MQRDTMDLLEAKNTNKSNTHNGFVRGKKINK